jgi:hypothetical protein
MEFGTACSPLPGYIRHNKTGQIVSKREIMIFRSLFFPDLNNFSTILLSNENHTVELLNIDVIYA